MGHLSIKDIHERLEELNGWEMLGNGITKEFHFNSFNEAMEFVHKIGEEAERQHHFPDITIKNTIVTIHLTTYEANGLTHGDFKMARVIEQMV